ncbi:hypothetical protein AB0Y20_11735 [Heyndrickxia oleronia]|jgi:hypothetical protein|uniref:hypothetical protein n=1 Tax=Heyndrickxia oleronia TaxID=38875 RepID=UPI003F20B303
MSKILEDRTEEIENGEILKSDEKSLRAKEFINILTDMILNYSQLTNQAKKQLNF